MPAVTSIKNVTSSTDTPTQPRRRRLPTIKVTSAVAGTGCAVAVGTALVESAPSHVQMNWMWVIAAVLAQGLSVLTVGAMYRPLLRSAAVHMPWRRAAALGAVSNAMTVTLPAGTVAAVGYLVRQFRRDRVHIAVAVWTVIMAAVLNLAAFAAVIAAATSVGPDVSAAEALRGAFVGLTIAAGATGLLWSFRRHPRAFIRAGLAVVGQLPVGPARRRHWQSGLEKATRHTAGFSLDARRGMAALGFASLTWSTDLVCFILSLHAVGAGAVSVGSAALAYGAGLSASSLSPLPAGVGVVEAGMAAVLSAAGTTVSSAMAGIFTYRLVAYGLVGATGWAIWALLRRRAMTGNAVGA